MPIPGSDFATINEIGDALASTATSFSMSVGDTFTGGISSGADQDWVAVTLTAGHTYTFTQRGAPSSGGTLSDSYLRLMNGAGTQIRYNDDGGTGFDSLITFTATSTGTYYINAGSFSTRTGTYTLGVTEALPTSDGTLSQLSTYLTTGYWTDSGRTMRHFDTSTSNVITVNITGLTADGIQLARAAMEAWANVANLVFQETTSGSAQIVFDDAASGAYSTSVVSGGIISSSVINVSTAWLSSQGSQVGTYGFQTYVHELGHALGLGHQGDYNGSASYGTDETFGNDSWAMSVMSYFDQTENTTTDDTHAYVTTAMMVDIEAIQALYGTPGSTGISAGNTVWGANSNLGGYVGTLFASIFTGTTSTLIHSTNDMAFTIYDQGGYDTLDLSPNTGYARVNLNPGTFSDLGTGNGNLAIASGTVIENYNGGSGVDIVFGNSSSNNLRGNNGNDWLLGYAGNDRLSGGAGADNLRGGIGNDWLYGNSGNDNLQGGAGIDWIYGGTGNDTIRGGSDKDRIYGGDGSDYIRGDNGNDALWGDNGNDSIHGGSGADWLLGGAGHDWLYGGVGNDNLRGDAGNDRMNGMEGNDNMRGGEGHDTLFGGVGSDTLYGDNGDDVLYGQDGNDVMYGGSDSDRLYGGDGNDTLHGQNGNDRAYGGNGQDYLRGGYGADWLYGEADSDWLYGDAGNDVLIGGAGADRLEGGIGNDTFIFGSWAGTGHDMIADFSTTDDLIRIIGSGRTFATLGLSDVGGNAVVDYGTGMITLHGIASNTLNAGDFDFI